MLVCLRYIGTLDGGLTFMDKYILIYIQQDATLHSLTL
jgi:hypothetical protein